MLEIRCNARDALTPDEAGAVAAAVRAGGAILFPTDTLYGLGADPLSAPGLAAVYRLKGRTEAKPLPVLVADASLVARFAAAVPGPWRALMSRLWPGPLTLLFPALPGLPPAVRSEAGKVALRVPGSALCRSVLRAAGGAL
ncbi:MAG TPA: Sua5/YciO/YrdC/YwlC family protein, partial [bacterium]